MLCIVFPAKAVTAVNRAITAGLEGDLGGCAAFVTDDIKHLAITGVAATGILTTVGTAGRATCACASPETRQATRRTRNHAQGKASSGTGECRHAAPAFLLAAALLLNHGALVLRLSFRPV